MRHYEEGSGGDDDRCPYCGRTTGTDGWCWYGGRDHHVEAGDVEPEEEDDDDDES